ncbi:MAG TPA: hypothetical protein VI488_02120 [Candidatus Angelobacter sp.]
MTLISAFTGAFGMVLISDSQEAVSGYAKRNVDKVEHNTGEPFPFAIAGSGDGVHIDAVKFEISGELLQLKEHHLSEIHEVLKEGVIRLFPKIYLAPSFGKARLRNADNDSKQRHGSGLMACC